MLGYSKILIRRITEFFGEIDARQFPETKCRFHAKRTPCPTDVDKMRQRYGFTNAV